MFILNTPAEPPVVVPVLMVQSRSNTNEDVVMQDLTPLFRLIRPRQWRMARSLPIHRPCSISSRQTSTLLKEM
jgi:hypothetical protein